MVEVEMTTGQIDRLHELVTAEGKQRIGGGKSSLVDDFIIEVKDDHLQVTGISNNDIAGMDIRYEDVESINETGKLVIKNAEELGEIPKRFDSGDKLTIKDDGQTLMFERDDPRKRLKLKTTGEDSVDSKDEGLWDNISYNEDDDTFITPSGTVLDSKVVVESRYLQEVVDDAGFIGADDYPFKLQNGNFAIDAGDDTSGRVQTEIPVEETKGEAESKYMYGLGGIVQNNDGELSLYFADNEGLIIENDTDNYRARYVITNVDR